MKFYYFCNLLILYDSFRKLSFFLFFVTEMFGAESLEYFRYTMIVLIYIKKTIF